MRVLATAAKWTLVGDSTAILHTAAVNVLTLANVLVLYTQHTSSVSTAVQMKVGWQ